MCSIIVLELIRVVSYLVTNVVQELESTIYLLVINLGIYSLIQQG